MMIVHSGEDLLTGTNGVTSAIATAPVAVASKQG